MSNTTCIRSKQDDFKGNLHIGNLHKEIVKSEHITSTLLEINTEDDQVCIVFTTPLTFEQETALNLLITNHSHLEPIIYNNVSKMSINSIKIKSKVYTRNDIFVYLGSDNTGKLGKIVALGHMDNGVTDYSISIYDKTHRKMIAEASFTNLEEDMVDLGELENIPTKESIIEICTKKTGGNKSKKAYINSVIFYYL